MVREAGIAGSGCGRLRGAGLWLSRLISRRAGYAGVFALLFALAWLPVCGVLAASGYSFFWDVDGLSQQYVWFVYTGQWLRGVFSSLLSGDGLQVPLWTMDSGFGVDTVQSLVCTVVNPFYAVSALVPEQWAEQAFEASLVLQAYCAGLAFSLWSVGHGERRATTMVGALAYVFAGNMTAIFLQPGFLFPALAFPLALYGADRVFDRRSPLPFVAVMAWVFAFSFYDAYMICVMLVLYCLAMFFWKVERGVRGRLRWVRLARWVAVFVGYVLLSAAVAAVLFLPQAMAVLGQERLEVHRAEQVLYAPTYYIKLIMGFTSFSFAGGDAYTGWSPLAVPVLLLLLMRRRRQPALFWSFVVLTVMLCVPFFGSLMNAFQYPTARWAWAYSAFVSLAIARLLPRLLEARKREKAVIGAVCVVYVVCAAALPVSGVVRAEAVVMAAMVAVCFLGSVLGYRAAVGLLAVLTAVAGSVCFCQFPRLIGCYAPAGELWSIHDERGVAGAVEKAESRGDYDAAYRYDRTSDRVFVENSNLITATMGANFYNSMYNDGVDELLRSLGNPATHGANHRFDSLGEQSYVQALLGVRYLYASDAAAGRLSPLSTGNGALARGWDATLYESSVALPLAFVQYSYITKGEYLALSLVERQEALLQAVVLNERPRGLQVEDGLEDLVFESRSVPFTVEATGCEWDGSRACVTQPGAQLTLTFSCAPQTEAYLCIRGMDYRDFRASDYVSGDQWDAMGLLGRAGLLVRETKDNLLAKRSRTTTATLDVSSPLGTQGVVYPNAEDPMYGGPRDWACNLGYSEAGLATATITFQTQGIYSFDAIDVVELPTALLERQAQALSHQAAQDIALGCNEISCRATLDRDGLLFFSVAYSDGWSARVDGEEAEVLKADCGFMAVALGEGAHTVELLYETPYLREGAALSLVGVGGTCVLLWWRRRPPKVAALRVADGQAVSVNE